MFLCGQKLSCEPEFLSGPCAKSLPPLSLILDEAATILASISLMWVHLVAQLGHLPELSHRKADIVNKFHKNSKGVRALKSRKADQMNDKCPLFV